MQAACKRPLFARGPLLTSALLLVGMAACAATGQALTAPPRPATGPSTLPRPALKKVKLPRQVAAVAANSWQPLRLHAFGGEELLEGLSEQVAPAWHALQQGESSFAAALSQVLASQLAPLGLSLRSLPIAAPSFLLHSQSQSHPVQQIAYGFAVNGVPLCEGEVKGRYRPGLPPLVLGEIPHLDEDAVAQVAAREQDWPAWQATQEIVAQHESFAAAVDGKEEQQQRCYHTSAGQLQAAWSFIRQDEATRRYQVIAGAEAVYKVMPLFFDLADTTAARVQAYTSNPLEGRLETFTTKVSGNGTLTSEFFKTVANVSGSSNYAQAESSSHDFVYAPDDERFSEASAFINATHMFEYFQSLGYEWHGPKPLRLRLHVTLSNTKNNALYEPEREGYPAISLGDGDGTGLRNLALDADVVSHEFGHHIVYQTLKSTAGESLVLHEGLADWFTFTRTGDSCLGESICPPDSNYCVVKEKCLRTADNNLSYDTAAYNAVGAHLKGQLISGLLWDLRRQMDPSYLTKVSYEAVSYLASSSGFSDFIVSLMQADKELGSASNACAIYEAAQQRGLSKVLAGIDCTRPDTWQNAEPTAGDGKNTTPTSQPSEKKDRGPFGCGVLAAGGGGPGSQGAQTLLVLLGLLLPLVLAWPRSRQARPLKPSRCGFILAALAYCPPLVAGPAAALTAPAASVHAEPVADLVGESVADAVTAADVALPAESSSGLPGESVADAVTAADVALPAEAGVGSPRASVAEAVTAADVTSELALQADAVVGVAAESLAELAVANAADAAAAVNAAVSPAQPSQPAAASPAMASSNRTAPTPNDGILLALSVVWEGEGLSKLNLEAIAQFRQRYPNLRLIHFMNPAYFTRQPEQVKELAAQIKTVIQPGDPMGLHLHPWKSLVEASGVSFRQKPSVWGHHIQAHECAVDCGHEVPLSIYTESEITAMLNKSFELFAAAQLPAPQAFLAGSWMAAPHVLEAVARSPIRYDFSPVPAEVVKNELEYYPVYGWLSHLWPGIHALSQPVVYYTSQGQLTQVVSNGASVDYRRADEILRWYTDAANLMQKGTHKQLVLHLSLYQESAFTFLPRLAQVLEGMARQNLERPVPLHFLQSLNDIPTPQAAHEPGAGALSLRPLQWEKGL